MAQIGPPSGGGATALPQTFDASCDSSVLVGHWVYSAGPKVGGLYPVGRVDPNNEVKIPAVGIVRSKPATTQAVVQFSGVLAGVVSGLDPRKLCYVAADGTTTQFPPGTSYEQIVGAAIDSATIIVRTQWIDLPTPVYASHLGTTDGSSDARVPFPSGTMGRVAEPTTPGTPLYTFSASEDWADGSNRPGIKFNQDLTTPGDVTELDVGTTVTVQFIRYTAIGTPELITQESIACNGADQVSTPNGYIRTVGVSLNAAHYEGQVRVLIPFTVLLAGGGYVRTVVIHSGMVGGPYQQDWEIFYDPYDSPPVAGVPTISEDTPILKYLSGIRYYDDGSTFDIEGVGTDVFKSMFHSTPILLSLGQLAVSGPSSLDYDDPGISPNHPPYPVWDDPLSWAKNVDIDTIGVRNLDAIISHRVRDPFNVSAYQYSVSGPIMIDTRLSASSRLDEQFEDEDYRLVPQSNWVSAPAVPPIGGDKFDSEVVLDDVSNVGVQVFGGSLIYPVLDFTSPAGRRPVQQVGADYSILSGVRDFQRPYKHGTSPSTRSNVVLYLPGFDVTSIGGGDPDIDPGGSGDTNLFIMIPGVSSVWFDCGREFFSSQFPSPEPGCLVKSLSGVAGGYPSNEYWYFTFGSFSTTLSDRVIVVRAEYRSSSANEFSRILASNWN